MSDYIQRIFREYKIRDVLDVGANIGGWVRTWLANGATRVHAIEPEPTSYETLRQAFASDSRVESHRLGVSDRPDHLTDVNVFNCWTLQPEASKTLDRALEFVGKPPFDVDLVTIDDFLHHMKFEPELIKIDVDGYDAKALRGAREYLAAHHPIVLFEMSYLPFFVGDCCECMVREIFEIGYTIEALPKPGKIYGEVYRDARAFMRVFPWDTSYDVLLIPPKATS